MTYQQKISDQEWQELLLLFIIITLFLLIYYGIRNIFKLIKTPSAS